MATLEKRGKGSWRVGFQVRTPAGWQWVRRTVHVDPNLTDRQQRKEAEKALVRLEMETEAENINLTGRHYSVRSWSEVWMETHVKPNCSPVTYTDYREMLNTRILPILGDIPLEKLTPVILSNWLAQVRLSPRLTPYGDVSKPLADSTVAQYYAVLDAMLVKAVQMEVLPRNPLERVTRPRIKRRKANYLTEERAIELLRCLNDEPNMCYRAALLLALLCGLRLGEVGDLKLSDVNWVAGSIDISRALKYTPDRGNFSAGPKSDTSSRIVMLPAGMMTVLREAREYQEECQQLIPHLWRGEGWIVHNWDGSQMNHNASTRWFRKFADQHGFEGVRFHDLRHTHATLLLANNIDVVAVSSRLGHSSPNITLRTYAHVIARRDRDAANTLDQLFSGIELPPAPDLPKM